jgi:hypothetical protein
MSGEEQAKTKTDISDLCKRVSDLEARCTALEEIGSPDMQANRRTRFQENGNWARHYSTVRMTTTTFLVGVSLGILSFRWPAAAHPPISFVALSGIVWIIAVSLFLVFTRLTYQEMESARLKRNLLPDGVSGKRDKPYTSYEDWASWIVGCLSLFYGLLLYYLGDVRLWHFVSPISSSFSRRMGCAVPGSVIFIGLLALVVTLRQRPAKANPSQP